MGWRLAVISFCLLALACGQPSADAFVVRDSAGVRIAESIRPSGAMLVFDSIPAVTFGAGAVEFISPISAVRLSDGRVVAAGWAMTELQHFDSTGGWLGTVGRRGGGPGEFEALGSVYRTAADSLVTFEPGTQRLQRWTPAVENLSLSLLVSPAGWPTATVSNLFPDGDLMLRVGTPDSAASDDLISRERVTLFRQSRNGERWDSLFSYLSGPSLRHPDNPNWPWGAPVLSASPSLNQRDGRIVFTTGERSEFRIHDGAGRVMTIVRWAAPERVVTAAERDRLVEGVIAASPEAMRQRLAPRVRRAATASVRPPISSVRLAADGRVWVLSGYAALGEAIRANVFDSLGRWEAELTLPEQVRILQIDTDGVLGFDRDEDGFHHLRFYRLRRGDP